MHPDGGMHGARGIPKILPGALQAGFGVMRASTGRPYSAISGRADTMLAWLLAAGWAEPLGQVLRAPVQRGDGLRLLQAQRDGRVDALGEIHQRQADDLGTLAPRAGAAIRHEAVEEGEF